MDTKKLLVIFLIVLVAMVVAGFYLLNSQNVNTNQQQSSESSELSVERTEFSGAQFPPAIPSDLPVEAGSRVLTNESFKTNDGRIQSSVTITTTASLNNALNNYVRFFETKNWLEITSLREVTTEKLGTVLQYKSDRLMIEVKNNTASNDRVVSLVLLQSSPSN